MTYLDLQERARRNTRGTLEAFSRDELQGVVAHKFAHIRNGDKRNSAGLVSALRKIAASANGSTLRNSNAGQVGHLLFGAGRRRRLFGLFDTHPAIEARCRAGSRKATRRHRISRPARS